MISVNWGKLSVPKYYTKQRERTTHKMINPLEMIWIKFIFFDADQLICGVPTTQIPIRC